MRSLHYPLTATRYPPAPSIPYRFRRSTINSSMSVGRGASTLTSWPRTGGTKPGGWAWGAWRGERALPGGGVDEAEGLGVERLAVEPGLAGGLVDRPIDLLAEDRVAHLGHVNADLVGPARLQPAGKERGHRAEPLDDPEVRHRSPALALEPG